MGAADAWTARLCSPPWEPLVTGRQGRDRGHSEATEDRGNPGVPASWVTEAAHEAPGD